MVKFVSGVLLVTATARFAAFLAFVIVLLLQSTSWAQSTSPSDLPPEKVRQFLELASNPEVKTWLEGKAKAPVADADSRIAEAISNWEVAVNGRLQALAAAFGRAPAELANAPVVVMRDVNSGRPGLVVGILAILLMVGFGSEWLTRRALEWLQTTSAGDDPVRTFLSDAIALLTFSVASVGLLLAVEWPPLLRKVLMILLLAFVAFRFVHRIARLLLAFSDGGKDSTDQLPAASEGDGEERFWLWRIDLIAGCFWIGWAAVSIMPSLAFSTDVTKLVALMFGLGILTVAIEAVWRRPGTPSSSIVRSLLTLYIIMLWLAWVAGLVGLLFVGIYVLVLPALTRSVGRLAQVLADRKRLTGTLGAILRVVIVRGARALVIAAAIGWLAYAWRFSAAALAGSEVGRIAVNGVLNAVVILLVADLVWQSAKALIAYRMDLVEHAGGGEDETARSGRLRTLLPIFRNTLAVFIGVVAVLTILSGLGVQIAPLIAGAGIFGVAMLAVA